LEPANGEPCVLAVKADVGSLLVLMHRLATNLTGTLFRVSFGLVDAFAMTMAGHGIHGESSDEGEWD